MLKCAEPLRNELKSLALEKQADVNKRRVEETTTLIATRKRATLEHSALRAKL
jgi:hypothetical protein